MEIKINIISTETIKPSSPTPISAQKHKLSFLDQLVSHFIIPFVYFYRSNPKIPNSQNSNTLKKSLSQALTRFYPLAGRLVGNLYVYCNDGGVPLSIAKADCDLSLVITNPVPKNMHSFLPHNKITEHMEVQAKYFRCGGLIVGLILSHKISDGQSIISFANTWSGVARNRDISGILLLKFDASAYFPPQDIFEFHCNSKAEPVLEEELALKIFTLTAPKVALLQEQYSDKSQWWPSWVEAVLAFLWIRFTSATGMRANPRVRKILVTVQHTVNLWNR